MDSLVVSDEISNRFPVRFSFFRYRTLARSSRLPYKPCESRPAIENSVPSYINVHAVYIHVDGMDALFVHVLTYLCAHKCTRMYVWSLSGRYTKSRFVESFLARRAHGATCSAYYSTNNILQIWRCIANARSWFNPCATKVLQKNLWRHLRCI